MLDLVAGRRVLELRVFDDQLVNKCLMNRNVNVFVNCGGDQKSFVLTIVGWQVGAATSERDPQRATSNDHGSLPRYRWWTTSKAARASRRPAAGFLRRPTASENA